jgi:hypothetical protein
MTCEDVGRTNTDIAGLGVGDYSTQPSLLDRLTLRQIVISFATQAGISLILSIWSLLLWKPAIDSVLGGHRRHASPFLLLIAWICRWRRRRKMNNTSLNSGETLQLSRSESSQNGDQRRKLRIWYDKHESRWVLQKKIIDQILLTVSDLQTMNGK